MTRKKSVLLNEKEKKLSDCVKRGEKCLFLYKTLAEKTKWAKGDNLKQLLRYRYRYTQE